MQRAAGSNVFCAVLREQEHETRQVPGQEASLGSHLERAAANLTTASLWQQRGGGRRHQACRRQKRVPSSIRPPWHSFGLDGIDRTQEQPWQGS